MNSLLINGELVLMGDIGDPFGYGDGVTPQDVVRALAEHGPGPLRVRLNSGGGIATDGVAIYSILAAHPGEVSIVVEGLAASAASLILMAGAKREIRRGAMIMIHDAGSVTFGDAADHRERAEILDKISAQFAAIYAATTGRDEAEIRAEMQATTWLTADEALEKGFVTEILESPAVAAAAFDYSIYASAPAGLPRRPRVTADPRAGSQREDVTMKTWIDKFYASAEKSNVPLADLNAIVARCDTLEAAQAALIERQSAPPAAAGSAGNEASDEPQAKAWVTAFYASAEKAGMSLADLNAIVAKSADLAAAQAALIDAMAARGNEGKPAAGNGADAGQTATAFDAGREKVLAMKGRKAT